MITVISESLSLPDGKYLIFLAKYEPLNPIPVVFDIEMVNVVYNTEQDDIFEVLGLRGTNWAITGITKMKED